MKRPIKNFCFITVFLMFLSFLGCVDVQEELPLSSAQNMASSNVINVSKNTSNPEPSKEYVLPQEMIQVLGRTPEQILQDIEEPGSPSIYIDAWINSANTITLLVTEEQRQNWVANSEKVMNEYIDHADDSGFTIQVSKEKDRMTLYVKNNVNSLSVTSYMGGAVSQALINRIFCNIPWEEIGILLTIVNQDTGHVLIQANLPFENFNLTPDNWETSKTRDVVDNPLPYEIEGYPVPKPSLSLAEQSNSLASSSVAVVGAASTSSGTSASTSEAHQAQAPSSSAESNGKAVQPAPNISIVVQDEAPTSVVVENVQPIELTFGQKAWIWIYDNPIVAILILLGAIAAIVIWCKLAKQKLGKLK